MKNIKNNMSISDFDDFLCKLEEKEEFSWFSCNVCTGYCNIVTNRDVVTDSNGAVIIHDRVDGQNDEYELDTEDEQNDDEQELATDDEQDDEYEPDDDQDKSGCWIVWCTSKRKDKRQRV